MNDTLDPSTSYTYWCFISFSHADNRQRDRSWATWLHREIERYQIPPELAGSRNARGDVIPKSIYPAFRDEESLPANARLSDSIARALQGSRFLVVLCSPRAVESRYVTLEVRRFKELGRHDQIVAVIIDGEPGHPERECFPTPLRLGKEPEGLETEPLAADFRLPDGREGFTTPKAYRQQLEKEGSLTRTQIREETARYQECLELMKLKIIAGILGLPLEQLRDRHKAHQLELAHRKARIQRWLTAGFAALACMALTAGVLAALQWQRAVEEARRASATLSRSDLRQAVDCIQKESTLEAIPYLARAIRSDPGNAPAVYLLSSVIRIEPWSRPLLRIEQPGRTIKSVSFSSDAKLLRVHSSAEDERISVFNVVTGSLVEQKSGNEVCSPPATSELAAPACHLEFVPNTGTAVEVGGRLVITGPEPVASVSEIHHPGYMIAHAFSPYDRFLLTLTANGTARVYDLAFGKQMGFDIDTGATQLAWAPDLSFFALWNDCTLQLWSLPFQDVLPSPCPEGAGQNLSLPWTSTANYESKLPSGASLEDLVAVDGFESPAFVAVSPDRRFWVAVIDREEGDNVLVWDSVRKAPLTTLSIYPFNTETGRQGPTGLVFSPSGRRVAFGGGPSNFPTQLVICNTASWEVEVSIPVKDTVLSAVFSPDETLLAASVLRFGVQFFDWQSRLNVSGPPLGNTWGDEHLNWQPDGTFQFLQNEQTQQIRCLRYIMIENREDTLDLATRSEALSGLTLDERGNLKPVAFTNRLTAIHARAGGESFAAGHVQLLSKVGLEAQIRASHDGWLALEFLKAGLASLDPEFNSLAAHALAEAAPAGDVSYLLASERLLRVALGELRDQAKAETEASRLLSVIDRFAKPSADRSLPLLTPEAALQHRNLVQGWLKRYGSHPQGR